MRSKGKGERAPVVPFPQRTGSGAPRPGPSPAEGAAEALERRLRRVTRTILAAGFGAALVAWIVARARPDNPLGYDPLDNKKYIHDLQVYGGTANVIAAEFREWFAGLWYGTNLAYTIAVLTVVVVLVVRFYLLTSPSADEEHGGARKDAS
jgi:hypothetical protein